ncbi:MAG: hypothetical protein IIX01_04025 [Clostridia bacterium]|nr:hypothetical protein [Clostridia bacterium]
MKLFVLSIPLLYGLFNGFGDYFITLATLPGALGSSVTFPIINGGTIIFSTLIGFFAYKEKPNLKIIISIVIVLCATLLFMFSTV